MRLRPAHSARSGYTLLEVLLASVIGLFLLAGLYVAMDVTLLRMDSNRDLVASNDLGRAIANRLNADVACTLGPLPPKSGGDTSSTASATATTGSTGTAAASATGTGSTGTSSTSGAAGATASSSGTAAASSSTATTGDYPLGMGVIGTDKQITLFVSRVPTSLVDIETAANATAALPGDLKRVTYYLASDGNGLCRQERPWVTADGVSNSPDPDRTDEASEVLATEVKDMTVEYFDGSAWQTSWDGSATGSDGVTLTGPPRAVRFTFTLEIVGKGGPVQKQFSHTVAIRAAPGLYAPPLTTGSSSTTTTGGN